MTARRWLRRAALAAGGLLILSLLALVALWTQRRPIAADAIDRELARRGVTASYRIATIGLRRQRLEDVRLGDRAHPDLIAKTAEVELAVGLGGVSVKSIVARGVRLRARLQDGKVSFGSVDKLLPPPSGAPFTLPDLRVTLSDARMRLETPMGAIGFALDGHGNLADGFAGRLAVVAPRLLAGGCALREATAFVNIAITDRKPALDGPVRAAAMTCGTASISAPQFAVDGRLNEALTRWQGSALVEAARGVAGGTRIGRSVGTVTFDGDRARTAGHVSLSAAGLHMAAASAAVLSLEGDYRVGARGLERATGTLGLRKARADAAVLTPLASAMAAAAGTPVAPIATGLGQAIGRAVRDVDADASFDVATRPAGFVVHMAALRARSRSGARAALDGGSGITYATWLGAARIDGALAVSGGGLPPTSIRLRQPTIASAISGEARIGSMATAESAFAVSPITFGPARGGGTRFATLVTMSGPLAGGRVTRLATPFAGRFDTRAGFRIGEGCQPLAFASLEIAGMRFGPTRLPLCPLVGGAILAREAGGGVRGGARIPAPRLSGHIGTNPITIAAATLAVPIDRPGFLAEALAIRMGEAPDPTRLDVARIAGDVDARGIAGRFEGADGKIAHVPLLVSHGAGPWRLAGGRIVLGGSLDVADEAASPRFRPLTTQDFALRFADGIIAATATLREPRSGIAVTSVDIIHHLSNADGRAILNVAGIPFDKALQPDALTPLALGVVANVEGIVTGRGEIRWDQRAVTSDGVFRTDAMNLAAAFGPVTGLKGEIRFTDLLALETAPGQTVTLAEVNPGIAVTDGVVRYQLLPGQRIRIEEGRWPFSGGLLVLEPTILDMGASRERRMTFRVEALDAAKFIQRFELDNVAATGLFDGALPMVFDENGGRIVGGRILARPEGGTLAYVGDISNADLGMFAQMAFDALKRMRYRNLAIEFDGAIDGEIVSKVIFTGNNELPVGGKAPGGLTSKFIGLPFKFNIVIKAPFRGLMGAMKSFIDPGDLIRSQLPQIPADASVRPADATSPPPIQPAVSEDKR
jgi:hypothetical protein